MIARVELGCVHPQPACPLRRAAHPRPRAARACSDPGLRPCTPRRTLRPWRTRTASLWRPCSSSPWWPCAAGGSRSGRRSARRTTCAAWSRARASLAWTGTPWRCVWRGVVWRGVAPGLRARGVGAGAWDSGGRALRCSQPVSVCSRELRRPRLALPLIPALPRCCACTPRPLQVTKDAFEHSVCSLYLVLASRSLRMNARYLGQLYSRLNFNAYVQAMTKRHVTPTAPGVSPLKGGRTATAAAAVADASGGAAAWGALKGREAGAAAGTRAG